MNNGAGTVLIAGGGGFIGGHLAAALSKRGARVRAVDRKPLDKWFQMPHGVEARQLDLSTLGDCREAVHGVDAIYNVASDMGGMGFIETHKAECMLSVLINTHLLIAAREANVGRFFFASSACVYAADCQAETDARPLRESDAYPAMPEDGYGWEKLFSERMCRHFREDFGLETRVARYHNVYGANGSFNDGREKAPAALCRKIATAVLTGRHEIDIWGDGEQTRSFTYIDDCVKATIMIFEGPNSSPVNVGSSEQVSINQMVSMIEEIAGVTVKRNYSFDAPTGVRGRNSDNTMFGEIYGWEPSTRLADGLERTYRWIFDRMSEQIKGSPKTQPVGAFLSQRLR